MFTFLVSLVLALSTIVFPHTVFAQDLDWTKVGSEYTPLTQIATGNYISGFLQLGLGIVVTMCLIFLLIGGFRWVTSKGEKEALAKSQKTISGALIGLVIAMAIFLILGLLSAFTHIDLLRFCIPGVAGQCNIQYTGGPGPIGNPGPGPAPGAVGPCGCGGSANGLCATIGTVSNDAGSCYTCQTSGWQQNPSMPLGNCSTPVACYTCTP